MRIGFFGGTFDPFHNGHLALLESAYKAAKLQKIIVMPVGTPPHKHDRIRFAAHRYEMARLATENLKYVELSDLEIRREGKAFTLDTVRLLKASHTNKGVVPKIDLISGSDIIEAIENWHEPAALLQEVRLLVALRGDADAAALEIKAERLRQKYEARIKFFPMDRSSVSSTALRAALQQCESIKDAVPDAVYRFIKTNRIYDFAAELAAIDDATWAEMQRLERLIWPLMPQRRRGHTINVTLYAIRLALRHGLDVRQAALAGMAHDCAKYLPLREQRKLAKRAGFLGGIDDDVLHGPAGSYYARKHFGITDRDVLAAIFYHTTSRGLMTRLDQVLYLADKIEYGRPYKDLAAIRKAAAENLDKAMQICLTEVYKALARRKKTAHPFTEAARLTLAHFGEADSVSKRTKEENKK